MNKNKKSEELQSRRQFFKNAAKGALPILGAIVLANVPGIMNAAEESPMGCTSTTCSGGCKNGCRGCEYTCSGSCKNSCRGGCQWSSK